MKRLLVVVATLALAFSSMTSFAAEDDITVDGLRTQKSTPADCDRLVENGKKVVEMRDNGVGLATATAALLKVHSLRDRQYRITLPLLMNFTTEVYGDGKTLASKDLTSALSVICRSDVNREWVYF